MLSGAGIGKTVLLMELIRATVENTKAFRSSQASASARVRAMNFSPRMKSADVLERTVLVYRQMNDRHAQYGLAIVVALLLRRI